MKLHSAKALSLKRIFLNEIIYHFLITLELHL